MCFQETVFSRICCRFALLQNRSKGNRAAKSASTHFCVAVLYWFRGSFFHFLAVFWRVVFWYVFVCVVFLPFLCIFVFCTFCICLYVLRFFVGHICSYSCVFWWLCFLFLVLLKIEKNGLNVCDFEKCNFSASSYPRNVVMLPANHERLLQKTRGPASHLTHINACQVAISVSIYCLQFCVVYVVFLKIQKVKSVLKDTTGEFAFSSQILFLLFLLLFYH